MKNIKLVTGLFLILTAFTFTSCENEPIDGAINLDDFNGGSNEPMVFKADFSGNTWNGTEAQALVSSNSISIGATKADGSTFSILIQGTTTGTYMANDNILAYTPSGSDYGYWSINLAVPEENTGSITITNIDAVNKKISGTFAYKGYWSDATNTSIIPVQFTNGVFTNIPYESSTPPPSDDSFYAKVDGSEFVENQIDGSLITNVSGMPDQISIVGSKTNGDNVGLNIVRSLAVGTYNFTGPLGDQVNGRCLFNDVLYSAESGSIIITLKTDTRIKGTFNMVVKNFTTSATKTVTEGSFDVVYN